MRIRIPVVFFLALGLTASVQAASKQWLHIHVEKPNQEERVKINIPISLVETILPLVEEKGMKNGKLRINESDLRVEDLRRVWNEIRDEGEGEFISIENKDTSVRVFIEGNFLLVQPEEQSRNKVDIRVPLTVVDAMLSGDGDQLNLLAAVKALKESGINEIISIQDKESTVRVWIDQNNRAK